MSIGDDMQTYVINGWWYKTPGEIPVCDDCGFTEGRGHDKDCRRYSAKEQEEISNEDAGLHQCEVCLRWLEDVGFEGDVCLDCQH